MQTVFLLFFTLFWSAGALFFDGLVARGIFKQLESRHYPSATGTVTHSEVTTHHGSKGGTSYKANINYRFDVAGKAFTGSRLRFNPSFSDSASANSLVAAHRLGSTVQVFYNPNDPQDSLLFPGVNGSDFLVVLFLTPFNAVMLGFWIWTGGWLRERLFRPLAGGVKIIADGMSTRVRLPQFGAVGWGLVTAGGMGFVSVFIVAFSTKMQPSIGFVLTTIAAVYLAGVGVAFWQWRKISSGIDDLVINEGARTLDLPQTLGRQQPLSVGIADIESLTVETIEHISNKGSRSYTFAPTLRLRGPHSGDQKLADWSDKMKADAFADWLRRQLAL
ncbi:MAG: DUF3592 domain-containing protein [Verrucomicrobiota bacterium]|jgi:hypothetical protein